MTKVYIADLKNDLGAYVAWQIEYKERTGYLPEVGRDQRGDYVEIADEADAISANLLFS